jgi:hypothetical protein
MSLVASALVNGSGVISSTSPDYFASRTAQK